VSCNVYVLTLRCHTNWLSGCSLSTLINRNWIELLLLFVVVVVDVFPVTFPMFSMYLSPFLVCQRVCNKELNSVIVNAPFFYISSCFVWNCHSIPCPNATNWFVVILISLEDRFSHLYLVLFQFYNHNAITKQWRSRFPKNQIIKTGSDY
jgi:hypothetical protein